MIITNEMSHTDAGVVLRDELRRENKRGPCSVELLCYVKPGADASRVKQSCLSLADCINEQLVDVAFTFSIRHRRIWSTKMFEINVRRFT